MYEYDLLRYRYVDNLIKETICSKIKHAFRRRATLPRAGRAGGEREPLQWSAPNLNSTRQGRRGRESEARVGGGLVELPPCSYPRIISLGCDTRIVC